MSVLIDSGVFYGFYNKRDIHHVDSICLLTHILEGRFGRPYTLDLVISEAYTLLRYRIGYNVSRVFLEALGRSGIEIIFLDNISFKETVDVLKKYRDRNLSFTDAFIVYIAESYKLGNIASYDERSFSGIIKVIGREYAKNLSEKELKRIINMTQIFK